jgi:hypothetical protein
MVFSDGDEQLGMRLVYRKVCIAPVLVFCLYVSLGSSERPALDLAGNGSSPGLTGTGPCPSIR